jgi:hypothetical protein
MRYGWRRRLGILAGLFALAAGPALAQDQTQEKPRHERGHDDGERGHADGARRHDPERKIEHLREALDLTDAQVAQARSILAEQGEKHRALAEGEDREARRTLHEETHARLVAILDETQKAKLEEMKGSRGEGRGGHDGEGHRRHGGEDDSSGRGGGGAGS